jgi:uncharacterized protein YybS (DUF2232 family)
MSSAFFRDWLICTAASFLLFAAGIFLPVFSVPAMLVFSLPSALLAVGYGVAAASSSVCMVALLLSFAAPAFYGLMYFFMFGLPGTCIGLLARSQPACGDLLMISSVMEFMGKLAGMLVFSLATGMNALSPDASEIEKIVLSLGLQPAEGQTLRAVIDQIILLVPYSMMFFSVLETMLCLILLSYIHKKRTETTIFTLPPFGDWRFPRSILIALVTGFICLRISDGRENLYLVRQIGANLSELSRTLFIVQGLCCGYFFMARRGIPKLFRIMTAAMLFFVPFLSDIFAIVGVTDMGFDLRERFRRA